MPLRATIPVTASGVSAAKVVATMDVPASHQGTLRPERKNSFVSFPARRFVVEADGDVEEEVQDNDGPIGERKAHDDAIPVGELTRPKDSSKLASDRRIAMATTQKTTPVTLTLTDRAADEVRKFMADEKVAPETAGLRVGVLPGGCSGFKYSLNIEDKPLDDDVVIETGGVRCFVDGFSAQYLNGVTIDFKSNFQESGFAFENPNATGGCGCGTSFTV